MRFSRIVACTGAVVAIAALAGCSASSGGPSKTSAAPSSSASSGTSAAPTTSATSAPTGSSSSAATPGRAAPKLTNFRVHDTTWVGADGWALCSADCLSGGGQCDAIEHTTNGGRSWASLPAPVANIVAARPCTGVCVSGLRFASDKIGYAFGGPGSSASDGTQAMFMTTDGGLHWQRQAGGAVALEALNGTVLRVVSTTPGCPPGCNYRVQTAAVGSTSWHTVSGVGAEGVDAQLVRAGHNAYVEVFQNPAGGANDAHATLFTSGDDGTHWVRRGEPCPQHGSSEVDSRLLSASPAGGAAILCASRGGDAQQVITTTDGGASWHGASRNGLGSDEVTALGAVTGSKVVVASDRTYRSTNRGASFHAVGPGQLSDVGFASTSVGHAVSANGRTIWTTTDGGASWTGYTFH